MEIIPQLTQSVITVKGNLVITDKCNFESRNFTFINARESYWMGGKKGSKDGITVSDQFVYPSAFPATFKYPLRQAVGAEVNFKSFDEFRLFERDTNTLIAVASMPTLSGGGNGGSNSGAKEVGVLGTVLFGLVCYLVF